MDSTTLIIIGAIVVGLAIIGIAAYAWNTRRESNRLRETFGSEYDHTYQDTGNGRAARAELKAREDRVSSYELREIAPEERRAFSARWQAMQSTFVDDPRGAVRDADALLADVMRARGYASADSTRSARIADVSVGHDDEAAALREASDIAALNRSGEATTEQLRRAIKDFGLVFDTLLHERQAV